MARAGFVRPGDGTSQSMSGEPLTRRTAFYVSDGTGITVEALGQSLISQFPQERFARQILRFVDTPERAELARERINRAAFADGCRPLVFSTLVKPPLRAIVRDSNALFLDLFATFIKPLEQELGIRASDRVGLYHGLGDLGEYSSRIEALDFTLHHDDGCTTKHLEDADIIVVGISRTGKTPTCLYLSMHYGIRAANFPLTEEDLESPRLPESLRPYRSKLLGLTSEARRLQQIRHERYPDSRYASIDQCEYEIRQAEELFRRLGIRCLPTTLKSIEEIAATIVDMAGLDRRVPSGPAPAHV